MKGRQGKQPEHDVNQQGQLASSPRWRGGQVLDRALNKRRQPVRHTGQFRSRRGMMREHVLLLKHAAATQEFCAPSWLTYRQTHIPSHLRMQITVPIARTGAKIMEGRFCVFSGLLWTGPYYCPGFASKGGQLLRHRTARAGSLDRSDTPLKSFSSWPFRIGELCI